MIFQESICAKLGGTMKLLEINMENFHKIHHSINANNFSLKSTIGVKNTIDLNGSLIEGESDFKMLWIIKTAHFVHIKMI